MRRMIPPLMLFVAACQPAPRDLTEAQETAIADSVTAVHNDMWRLWLAEDLDSVMTYFLNSPEVGWGFPGGMEYGYENLTDLFRSMLDGTASQDYTAAERRVDVLSRDAVCVRESGPYSVTTTAGETREFDNFAMTTIWVRRDGEWKIIHGHEFYTERESGD